MLNNLRNIVNDYKKFKGTGKDFLENMFTMFSERADETHSKISPETRNSVHVIYTENEEPSFFSWSYVAERYIKNDANGRIQAIIRFVDHLQKTGNDYDFPIKCGRLYQTGKPVLYFDVSEIANKNLMEDCEKKIVEKAEEVYDTMTDHAREGKTCLVIISLNDYDECLPFVDDVVNNINKSNRFEVPIEVKHDYLCGTNVYFVWE